jgi:hypothetical protein
MIMVRRAVRGRSPAHIANHHAAIGICHRPQKSTVAVTESEPLPSVNALQNADYLRALLTA